jgi:hypothetical protein
MLGRYVYRVTPAPDGGWVVLKEGTSANDNRSDTREAAVATACALAATDEPSKVVIDNPDGTIAEERVFGTDEGLDPAQG